MKKRTATTGRKTSLRRLIVGGALATGLLALAPATGGGVPGVETTAQTHVYGEERAWNWWILGGCITSCPGPGSYCCGDPAY